MATHPPVRTWPSRVGLSSSRARRWRLGRWLVRGRHRPSSAVVSTSASSAVGIPHSPSSPFVVSSYLDGFYVATGDECGLYVVVREQRAFGIQPFAVELLLEVLRWHRR